MRKSVRIPDMVPVQFWRPIIGILGTLATIGLLWGNAPPSV
ncbi:hypothetical protein [Sandarakinorhabdus cyanobacteriorum]|nr:hypothetical protein [Sandarakinorhabdus cyanobacteriorum]